MLRKGILVCAVVASSLAQETPRFDSRLSVHTILREDIFAGFMANDDARLATADRNLARLEAERPDSKAKLTAWKAAIALTRAVRANEAGRTAECAVRLAEARSLFDEAARLGPEDFGVIATTGGAHLSLADRLPERTRAESWQVAYRSYQAMWKAQGPTVDTLPLHFKGELLAGLAQSAARTGHPEEAREFTRRILDTMSGTPYAKAAQRWTDGPVTTAHGGLACQTCHEPGRLSARTAALAAQQ